MLESLRPIVIAVLVVLSVLTLTSGISHAMTLESGYCTTPTASVS